MEKTKNKMKMKQTCRSGIKTGDFDFCCYEKSCQVIFLGLMIARKPILNIEELWYVKVVRKNYRFSKRMCKYQLKIDFQKIFICGSLKFSSASCQVVLYYFLGLQKRTLRGIWHWAVFFDIPVFCSCFFFDIFREHFWWRRW